MRLDAAQRGRNPDRQDRDDRVRRARPPPGHAQSARSHANAGRLLQRLGGGRRRPDGAAHARHADRRLGDPPGLLLRRVRLQADMGIDQRRGREAVLGNARHHRLVRARHRRHRAAGEDLRDIERRGTGAHGPQARVLRDALLGSRDRRRTDRIPQHTRQAACCGRVGDRARVRRRILERSTT